MQSIAALQAALQGKESSGDVDMQDMREPATPEPPVEPRKDEETEALRSEAAMLKATNDTLLAQQQTLTMQLDKLTAALTSLQAEKAVPAKDRSGDTGRPRDGPREGARDKVSKRK